MVVMIPLLVGLTFLNAGITHLCLALFKGTSKSYEATYRVICYSYSTWVFALVPCAGGLVSGIWWLVSRSLAYRRCTGPKVGEPR